MEVIDLSIIFFVGIIAGSFGTLVGGGSLITIPTLILLGLPPHTAIGTDRLGMTGVGTAGWYEFHRKRMISYRIGFIIGVPTMLGSMLGANLVLQIDEAIVKKAVALITVIIPVFILFVKPKIGIEKSPYRIRNHEFLIGAVASLFLGIYGGFYGAGTATFLSYVLIFLFRQTFLECAATIKIPALLLTSTAGSIFAINGAIHYPLAISLFMGTLTGSYVGAHYSDRIGNVWIKRLFFAIVLIMAIKLMI